MRNSSRCAGYASRIDRHCPPRTTAIISAAIVLAILMTTVGEAAAQSDTTSFVTTWRTTAVNDIITLPIHGTNMAISWGDGTTTTGASGPTDHTYGTPGSHTISVSGGLTRININGHADAPKLISIDQWGNSSWTNMRDAFRGASNMVYNAIDAPDLSKVTNMLNMFNGASSFNGNITNWDTSSVTNISSMFAGASSFNQPLYWNTSKVIGMREVFSGATAFNGNIADWDTSKVDRTSAMFSGASSFNGNITNWDTSRVTHMIRMFDGATAFNQPLDWNTSEVTNTKNMFAGASSFDQPLGSWDVSSALDMNDMFNGADAFDQNLGAWYIMLDSTAIVRADIPGTVGQISPQNSALNNQGPAYGPVSNIDSARFVIDSNLLKMTSITPAKATYTVKEKSVDKTQNFAPI